MSINWDFPLGSKDAAMWVVWCLLGLYLGDMFAQGVAQGWNEAEEERSASLARSGEMWNDKTIEGSLTQSSFVTRHDLIE